MKTALRLPRELHEQLTAAAAAGSVSLNAEMIRRLQGSFEEPLTETSSSTYLQEVIEDQARIIQELIRRIDGLQGTVQTLLDNIGLGKGSTPEQIARRKELDANYKPTPADQERLARFRKQLTGEQEPEVAPQGAPKRQRRVKPSPAQD